MNESSTEKVAPAAKVVLRKKAPFFCRTVNGCLAPLTENDGNYCSACVEKQTAQITKSSAPIPRVEDAEPAEGRYMTEAEWQACRARGPLWPTNNPVVPQEAA